MPDDLERRVAEKLWPYVQLGTMSQGTADLLSRDIAAALRATAHKAGADTAAAVSGQHGGVSLKPAYAAGLAALEGK